MNTHKNARLTFVRRVEMVQDITQRGVNIGAAALAHGVTSPTVRKWLGRFLALGEAGLADASSRPIHSPGAIASGKALAAALDYWNHHYNWHRPHQGIGGSTPMSRLNRSRNNLLTLHS
jgi:transposase-like protein